MHCHSSLLSKNFEKLIQCDQRLYELSQQPGAILGTPDFEPRRSIFENPNESKDCLGFNGLKCEQEASFPNFNGPASTCTFSSLSKNTGQTINIGNLAIQSVSDCKASIGNVFAYPTFWYSRI